MFYVIFYGVLLIYPFLVTRIIRKKVNGNKTNIVEILKNSFILILLIIGTIILSTPILTLYYENIPSSTSENCINTGGCTYKCNVNNFKYTIYLLIIGLILTIHHIISIKFIYNIFNNCKKIFSYVFMYIYISIIYFFDFILLIYLYGLLVILNYSTLINILRLIVILLPLILFLIPFNKKKQ